MSFFAEPSTRWSPSRLRPRGRARGRCRRARSRRSRAGGMAVAALDPARLALATCGRSRSRTGARRANVGRAVPSRNAELHRGSVRRGRIAAAYTRAAVGSPAIRPHPRDNARVPGRIDRIELRHGGGAIGSRTYKTGEVPKGVDNSIIQGGRELQRVLYSLAALTLIPDAGGIRAPARLPAPGSGAGSRARRDRRGHRRGRGPPSVGFGVIARRHLATGPGQRGGMERSGDSVCLRPRRAMPRASARPSSAPSATSSGPGSADKRAARHRRSPAGARRTRVDVDGRGSGGHGQDLAHRRADHPAPGRWRPPSAIAAITFGESAATGLAERVRRYVRGYPCWSTCPRSWWTRVPRAWLPMKRARCGRRRAPRRTHDDDDPWLLPGDDRRLRHRGRDRSRRAVMDAEAADTVLEEVFSEWFRDRMSGEAAPGDPIAVLSRDDPGRVVGTLWH